MDKNIVFATAGVERIRVDSSGNVGIGTTVNNSGYLFQVNGRSLLGGTTKGVEIGADAANTAYIDFHSQDSKTTDYDTRIQSFGGGVNDALGQLQYYGGSHYFYGNVGIGNVSPGQKLSVIGDFFVGGSNSNFYVGHSTDSTGVTINTINTAWFNSYCNVSAPDAGTIVRNSINAFFRTRDANVNLGACIQLLDVNTDANYPSAIRGGAITFGTVNGYSHINNPAIERMRIDPNGNVGIGTTVASSLLDIYSSSPDFSLRTSGGSTTGQYSSILFKNNSHTNAAILGIERANAYGGVWTGDLAFQTYYNSGLVERIRITADGRVGINNNNPSFPLQVSGSAVWGITQWAGRLMYDGVVTQITGNYNVSIHASHYMGAELGFITWSDLRIKKDIEHSPYGLSTIMQLRPVSYKFRNVLERGDRIQIGFIAQEVQEVLPEIINQTEDFINEPYAKVVISSRQKGLLQIQSTSQILVGDELKIVVKNTEGDGQSNGKELIATVLSTELDSSIIKLSEEIDVYGDSIFIVGKKVKDFLSIDYDKIIPVLTKAVQEQQQIIQTQNQTIQSLSDRLSKIEAFLSR